MRLAVVFDVLSEMSGATAELWKLLENHGLYRDATQDTHLKIALDQLTTWSNPMCTR